MGRRLGAEGHGEARPRAAWVLRGASRAEPGWPGVGDGPRIPSTHCGQTRTTYRPPAVCFLGGFPKIKGSQRFIPLLKTFFQVLGIPDMPRTVAWTPGAGGLRVTSSGGPAPARESLAVTNLGPPQPP